MRDLDAEFRTVVSANNPIVFLVVDLLFGTGGMQWVETCFVNESICEQVDPTIEQAGETSVADLVCFDGVDLLRYGKLGQAHMLQMDVE